MSEDLCYKLWKKHNSKWLSTNKLDILVKMDKFLER
jgi:hypothetical protein